MKIKKIILLIILSCFFMITKECSGADGKIVDLEAVIYNGEDSISMISGKLYKKGDKIGKYTVAGITQDGITLNDGIADIAVNIGTYSGDEKQVHLCEIAKNRYQADELLHRTKNYVLEYIGKPRSVDRYHSRDQYFESWNYFFSDNRKNHSTIVINFNKWDFVTSVSVF